MDEEEDIFLTALKVLMSEGGFTVYRPFALDTTNPDSVIEVLMLARSPEMLQAAAMDVLADKSPSEVVH